MQKTAEAEWKKVQSDKSLTPEQKKAAGKGIYDLTRESMTGALGNKAFDSYLNNPAAYQLKSMNKE
jgi:hypothetical protein